ncbi:hypothetical protein D3C75_1243600 [compost metagenome]
MRRIDNTEQALRYTVVHLVSNPVLFVRDNQPVLNHTKFMAFQDNRAQLREKHQLLDIPPASFQTFRCLQLHADHTDKPRTHSYRHEQKVSESG